MSCQDLEKIFGNAASQFAGFKMNKAAKKAYQNKDFEKSFIIYTYSYSLRNPVAARSLLYLIQSGKMGDLRLKGSKEEHLSTLNNFLLLGKASNRLSNIGEFVYYGMEVQGKKIERFSNAFRLYNLSSNILDDYYTDFSIAHMVENGEGTAKDLDTASLMYWEILESTLNENKGGFFFPVIAKLLIVKAKKTWEGLRSSFGFLASYFYSMSLTS